MFNRIIAMGSIIAGVLAMLPADANAYTYKNYGTSQCVFPPGDTRPADPSRCSFHPSWELTGGQQPGTIAIIQSIYSVTTAALVCVNPANSERKDVRIGVGGITLVTVSPETALAFDDRGRFFLNERIPTAVPEFEALCTAAGDPPGCGQAAFENFYEVTNADCRNRNWLPFEYYFGALTAAGTVYRDCTDPTDPNTCAKRDDNVIYSCTPDVSFKNYAKVLSISFTCTCIASCGGGQ